MENTAASGLRGVQAHWPNSWRLPLLIWVLASVGACLVANQVVHPRYLASTLVMLDSNKTFKVPSLVDPGDDAEEDLLDTHLNLMTCDHVLAQALEGMKKRFDDEAVTALRADVTVMSRPRTTLADLSVWADSPKSATATADAIVRSYTAFNYGQRQREANSLVDFLRNSRSNLKREEVAIKAQMAARPAELILPDEKVASDVMRAVQAEMKLREAEAYLAALEERSIASTNEVVADLNNIVRLKEAKDQVVGAKDAWDAARRVLERTKKESGPPRPQTKGPIKARPTDFELAAIEGSLKSLEQDLRRVSILGDLPRGRQIEVIDKAKVIKVRDDRPWVMVLAAAGLAIVIWPACSLVTASRRRRSTAEQAPSQPAPQ